MLELHDDEARQLGALLGGAYERPKIVEELEMALGEFQIEWIKVPNDSSGQRAHARRLRLPQADRRHRDRDPARVGVDRGAQPDDVILDGDTLVVVGKAGAVRQASRTLLADGPGDEESRRYTRQYPRVSSTSTGSTSRRPIHIRSAITSFEKSLNGS